MAPWRLRKFVATFTGLGVLAVFAAAGIFWKDFAAQYYLAKLRREPGYFEAILSKPEGTPEKKAVHGFLESHSGRQALVSLLKALFLESVKPNSGPGSVINDQRDLDQLSSGLIGLSEAGGFWYVLRWAGSKCWGKSSSQSPLVPVIGELLQEAVDEKTTLTDCPSLLFIILPSNEACRLHCEIAQPAGCPIPPDDAHRYACLVQKAPFLDPTRLECLKDDMPPMRALVKGLREGDDVITLSIGINERVKTGDEFIIHRDDELLGKAMVVGVNPDGYLARVLFAKDGQIKIGDNASTWHAFKRCSGTQER